MAHQNEIKGKAMMQISFHLLSFSCCLFPFERKKKERLRSEIEERENEKREAKKERDEKRRKEKTRAKETP